MGCFVNLVKSNFLKKASVELRQAQKLILTTTTNRSKTETAPTITHWSFDRKTKRAEFDSVWRAFEMDKLIFEGSDFLVEDYISIVEDDEVSMLCSLDKKLVSESIVHYYNVYGDWCYYKTKRKVANRYVHIALMWKAFPATPFALN